MRRTIYTCLLGFTSEVSRGLRVHALPEVQETSDLPCDTGSDPAKLAKEFSSGKWKGCVDLELVTEGWNDKGENTRWEPDPTKLETRAREARLWLRELALNAGIEDVQIVVVSHGGYLHYFTEDWSDHNRFLGTGWANTEFRSYTFRDLNDAGASVVETAESRRRRLGHEIPLTQTEQMELRASALKSWGDNGWQCQATQTKL